MDRLTLQEHLHQDAFPIRSSIPHFNPRRPRQMEFGMAARGYDVITIGGGIAASSLARAMAERGARVLALEREKPCKDRVRGEAIVSWGVAEANELGISRLLKEKCARDVPYVEVGSGLRDIGGTTLQHLPLLYRSGLSGSRALIPVLDDDAANRKWRCP
jgi:hypothetical protein